MRSIETIVVISSFMGGGRKRPIFYFELSAGLLAVLMLALSAHFLLQAPLGFVAAAVMVYGALGMLIGVRWKRPSLSLGAANRVTLLRGVLIALIAGTLVVPQTLAQNADLVVVVALVALLLDGLDGWVARRSGTASAFGARFDMELDAFFILVLCLCLMTIGKVGAWIVAIGAMRYVFVFAMRIWPWLDQPLPDSLRRKLVCVWQVASLMVCLSSWVEAKLASVLLGVALLLLIMSFCIDTAWLHRRRCVPVSSTFPTVMGVQAPSASSEAAPARSGGDDQPAWGRSEQVQQGARP